MEKTTPSAENREIARYAARAFGGQPRVVEYLHESLPLAIDILSSADRPCDGVTSYSTIGLSDYPMRLEDGSEFSRRLEICGACASTEKEFVNVLASAAFAVMRRGIFCSPGSVLRNYVNEYFPSSPLPHLYITTPFLWEDSLKSVRLETKYVSWLLAMPISDEECRYLEYHGDDALESLFEREQIDIFDIARTSVVS